jgi:hypothetical protein
MGSSSQQQKESIMRRPAWIVALIGLALVNYYCIELVAPWLPTGWRWPPYVGLVVAVLGLGGELFCYLTDSAFDCRKNS